MIAKSDFLTNVGFLVLGTLIAIFTTILSERVRRPRARERSGADFVRGASRPSGSLLFRLRSAMAKLLKHRGAGFDEFLPLAEVFSRASNCLPRCSKSTRDT